MGQHVASEVVKLMIDKGHAIKGSRVLVLGLTFKENCPDLRNTRVVDLVREFKSYGAAVDIYDPWADAAGAKAEYGLDLQCEAPLPGSYDAVVLAVAHDEFKAAGSQGVRAWANDRAVLYDIKGVLPKGEVDGRL
jgi:UDP-N-acetyl-D-galactosamine dehydrogenase